MQRENLLRVSSFVFLAKFILAATTAQTEEFVEFSEILDTYGFDWSPHEVKTEDGWYLTLFHIKSYHTYVKDDFTKLPIYLIHGSMDSALGYINNSE